MALLGVVLPSCTDKTSSDGWTLVWEDEFEGESFDESVWSKIPRGHSDWNDQMDENDACFEFKNGNMVLKGIVNPNENDTIGYITGGLQTKGKKSFNRGRIEIKAKLQAALRENLKDTTVIMIAQRIASVMRADRIAVIDNGTIVACDPHENLMKSCTTYQDIYASQMRNGGENHG